MADTMDKQRSSMYIERRNDSSGFINKVGQAVIRLAASVWVTAATYMWLAPLAFMERGYQAYGGECLAAAMAGMATYYILRR